MRRDALRGLWRLQPLLPAPARREAATRLAERLRGVHAGRGPLEPADFPAGREGISRHAGWFAAEAVSSADRVLAGELHLFGAWRPHARGDLARGIAAVNWTRDPLGGRAAPEAPSRDIQPTWSGMDARSLWEAGRLAHVLWLAVADALVGLPGTERSRGAAERGLYARAAVAHVRDFAATQPVGHGIHWTCAMEAGLRAVHLALALDLLRAAPEADALFWSEASRLLADHLDFLDAQLEDGQAVPNNHVLAGLAGTAAIACLLPDVPGARRRREGALRGFGRTLLEQTAPDGLSFEVSLPYHRFATELALATEAVARRAGASLGAPVLARVWRMVDVGEGATLPDGLLAAVGDNDSSRGFALRPRTPLETPHLASIRTALSGPGNPGPVEPEALFLCGVEGFRRLVEAAPKRAEPSPLSVDGLVVLRQGGRAATLVAGGNGQDGLGGHAHNDKLSTEIVLNRRRVVVDPGCPTYLADPEERDRYRSTRAHATACVDGEEQSPLPNRPFLLPDRARARVLEREAGLRAVAEHAGYLRLPSPVLHRREVALPAGPGDVERRSVVVTDRFGGAGRHAVELRWPSPLPHARVREATDEERRWLEALEELPTGEGRFDASRVVELGDGRARALLAVACPQPFELQVVESTWSPGWGERRPGRTVLVRVQARLPFPVTSAFVAPRAE